MFKKLIVQFVLLATISLMSGVELYAQTRIRFARGRSAATFSGTIPPEASLASPIGDASLPCCAANSDRSVWRGLLLSLAFDLSIEPVGFVPIAAVRNIAKDHSDDRQKDSGGDAE